MGTGRLADPALIGLLQKQGKALFYRDYLHHLRHSSDRFESAPGIRGLVMVVFALPSFPYVFKVIKDFFPPPKDTSRALIKEKYLLVKHHDRVGRMADTLEYSNVAFPRERFEDALVDERLIAQSFAPNAIADCVFANLDALDTLRSQFRPEFLNRIDDIIVFNSLTREHLREIVDIQLVSVAKLLKDRKVTLEVSAAAKDAIISEGYDPQYGARPMKRAIQRLISDPLSLKLITGDFVEGDTILVDAKEGEPELQFSKLVPATVA